MMNNNSNYYFYTQQQQQQQQCTSTNNPFDACPPPRPTSAYNPYYETPFQSPQPIAHNPFAQQQQQQQPRYDVPQDPWSCVESKPTIPSPYSPPPQQKPAARLYPSPPQTPRCVQNSGFNTTPASMRSITSTVSTTQTSLSTNMQQRMSVNYDSCGHVQTCAPAATTQDAPMVYQGGSVLQTTVPELGEIICTLQVRPGAHTADKKNNEDASVVIEALPDAVDTGFYDIATGARDQINETLSKVQENAEQLYNNVVGLVAAETAGKLADTAVRIGSHFIPGANMAMGIGIAVASGTGAGVFSATCQAQVKSMFLKAGHKLGDLLAESNRESLALARREGRSGWLRMSLCDQPVLLNEEQYAAVVGVMDPKKKERVLRELRQKGASHVTDKAGNRFPVLPLMSKKLEPENVLLVTPELSEKAKNTKKAPTPIDFKAGATKRNGKQRGLIGTLVGTTVHLAIYPAKKLMHDNEVKQRAEMAKDGLPEHGDYLLRHFIIVTLEKTANAHNLPQQTLLMLPAIKSDWNPETQPLNELLSLRVGSDRPIQISSSAQSQMLQQQSRYSNNAHIRSRY